MFSFSMYWHLCALTEDALKVGFTLESLDSPDPFVDTTVVPDGIREAIA